DRDARDIVTRISVDSEMAALQRRPDVGLTEHRYADIGRCGAAEDSPIRSDDLDRLICRVSIMHSDQRRVASLAILLHHRRQPADVGEKLAGAGDAVPHLVIELVGKAQGDILALGDALAPELDLVRQLDDDRRQDGQRDDKQETLKETHSTARIEAAARAAPARPAQAAV